MLRKHILPVLLLLAMLLSLCACASNGKDPAAPGDADTPDAPPATDTPATDTPDTKSSASSDYGGLTLPLTTNGETFRIFRNFMSSGYDQLGITFEDVLGLQEAEKLTGVHIDWDLVSDFDNQFPMVINSGDYPDAASSWTCCSWGVQLNVYADNEIILDLKDIVEQYCPNYSKLRQSTPDLARDTLDDSGRLLAFWNIEKEGRLSWMGPWAREDWIKEWGVKDTLETYDDWEQFMIWARDNYHPETGYALGADGIINSYLLTGFDLYIDWFVKDGKVMFSPIQPAFKDYIELLRRWYEMDLLGDSNFGNTRLEFNDYANGQVAIATAFPSWWDMITGMSEDEDFGMLPVQPPVKNVGDVRKLETRCSWLTRLEGLAEYVFVTCENPELFAQWADFFYSPAGSLLCDCGIENVSYTYDENGDIYYTEAVTNTPEGYGTNTALLKYVYGQIPHYFDWEHEQRNCLTGNALIADDIWDANWVDEMTFPQYASRNTKESEEYANIMNDMNTYINESLPKFVMGTMPMEEWDTFIQNIQNMGIDKVTEIQQNAYDRYMAR